MFYPGILPLISMFDALFRDGQTARRRLKVFYLVFGGWVLFCHTHSSPGLTLKNFQHLCLGTLPGMDISPSHWRVCLLSGCTKQRGRFQSVWRK